MAPPIPRIVPQGPEAGRLLQKMHSGRRPNVKSEFLAMIEGCPSLNDHFYCRSDNEEGARVYSGKATWPMLAKLIIREMEEVAPAV